MEDFRKQLEALRKQNRLSQDQLATDLKMSQSSISNYESGTTTPNLFVLKKIADYFKVPVIYFFTDVKEENKTSANAFEKLIELYERRMNELEENNKQLKEENNALLRKQKID